MPNTVLKGRVAVVTGVSRHKGIGFAIAQRLAEFGADIFIHSFAPFDEAQPWGADTNGIPALIAELEEYGTRIAHAEADFLTPTAPAQILSTAVKTMGHIDILVANHAYSTIGGLQELTADEIDRHLQINVRGTLLLVKEFSAQHDGRSGGRVILMTSGQHLNPMPDELAYVASKGALHQLTSSLSTHLVKKGITVNTVNPGATDTGYATAELYKSIRAAHPQGRWGQPADAARLISWLVTDDAQWISGQVINSTGGI